ncbi:uncharacterized protein LOC144350001 [Saccoglossus kowalevskii]
MQRTKPNDVLQIVINGASSGPSSISFYMFTPGGVYSAFQITYDPPDGTTVSPILLTVVDPDVNDYEITLNGLTPSREYAITAVTLSGTGYSQTKSDPYVVKYITGLHLELYI